MPLSRDQITELADAFHQEWNLAQLTLFADLMDFNFQNEATVGSVRDRALVFLNKMNSCLPPRDLELLQKLRIQGNARLQALASGYLTPQFISPTGLPDDAVLLGRAAFVDRLPLREVLHDFAYPSAYSTRVLIVRGDHPCGKSYSWEFIRHLAANAGAIARRLQLKNLFCEPREMLEQCFQLSGVNTDDMPKMKDDPQLARVDPLINWFKGIKLPAIDTPRWLVIDDINEESVIPAVREAAFALAFCAEEVKGNLWVILLGYNEPILDAELSYIGEDQPEFPDESMVADYFVTITQNTPTPVSRERAVELANLLFTKYPPVDKVAMFNIKRSLENIGEKLMRGMQP